jgi:hypothetical protein
MPIGVMSTLPGMLFPNQQRYILLVYRFWSETFAIVKSKTMEE